MNQEYDNLIDLFELKKGAIIDVMSSQCEDGRTAPACVPITF